jgi:chemotaxis protein CheC
MTQLTELQCDALGEIFNIGVGRAASSLSQIVNEP